MVFLSDHCHVVATEKVRNMRTWPATIHMFQVKPESMLGLIYDARGWGIDCQKWAAPLYPRNFEAETSEMSTGVNPGTFRHQAHKRRR